MKLATKAVDPRTVARAAQIQLRKAQEVLEGIQWSYPPADAVKHAGVDKGSWYGPARCPVCFAEWNREEIHTQTCRLAEAIRG